MVFLFDTLNVGNRYTCHWIGSYFVSVIIYHIHGAKLLPEPTLNTMWIEWKFFWNFLQCVMLHHITWGDYDSNNCDLGCITTIKYSCGVTFIPAAPSLCHWSRPQGVEHSNGYFLFQRFALKTYLMWPVLSCRTQLIYFNYHCAVRWKRKTFQKHCWIFPISSETSAIKWSFLSLTCIISPPSVVCSQFISCTTNWVSCNIHS